MRKVLLVGLLGVALSIPASAGAAVTLDPGTKLTVVCEQRAPFGGLPFRHATPPEDPFALERQFVNTRRTKRYRLGHRTGEVAYDPGVDAVLPVIVYDAAILVRRRGAHVFRLRVFSEQAVAWRGC